MNSVYAGNITMTIFGESHGESIGVVLDGLPPGLVLDMEAIEKEMDRRKPGGLHATKRKEGDLVQIQSGLFQGMTTGAPLAALIFNENTRSGDYEELRTKMRPGHSDYPGAVHYRGFNDYRGGGHFSGRLTAPFLFAGALAKEYLKKEGVLIAGHLEEAAGIRDGAFTSGETREELEALQGMALPLLHPELAPAISAAIEEARQAGDSVGAILEVQALGVRPGVGSPMLNSLESKISSLVFSVPGVKGISFGSGFALAGMKGSEANDPYYLEGGEVRLRSNHNGGILGGISSGSPIILHVAMKPTSSIAKAQNTIDLEKKEETVLEIKGRHDPIIGIRALPVVEGALALALLDAYLEDRKWD